MKTIPRHDDLIVAEQIISKLIHEPDTLGDETYMRPDVAMFCGFDSLTLDYGSGYLEPQFRQFVRATGANIVPAYQGACCYNLSHDHIEIFPARLFRSPDFMKYAFFHELTHWTGSPKRLGRLNFLASSMLLPDEYRRQYAREEAVAEIGAAILCSDHGVKLLATQFASYILGYKMKFGLNEGDLRGAAFDACDAVNYIRHITRRNEPCR